MKYMNRIVRVGENGGYFVTIRGKKYYLGKSVTISLQNGDPCKTYLNGFEKKNHRLRAAPRTTL